MSDIERDYNGNIFSTSYSRDCVQLVAGADHLKVIKEEIELFQIDSTRSKLTVTSPGPRFTGAIRFGESTSFCAHWVYLFEGIKRDLIKLFSGCSSPRNGRLNINATK